jgi:hypothetical protein
MSCGNKPSDQMTEEVVTILIVQAINHVQCRFAHSGVGSGFSGLGPWTLAAQI